MLEITDSNNDVIDLNIGLGYGGAHFAGSSDGSDGTLITLKLDDDAPVIATADKWAYSRQDILTVGRLDRGIIDEAYQMTSAKLLRIADLFPSLDLVGDPGQLDPFSTIEDAPWVGLPQNPVTVYCGVRTRASATTLPASLSILVQNSAHASISLRRFSKRSPRR